MLKTKRRPWLWLAILWAMLGTLVLVLPVFSQAEDYDTAYDYIITDYHVAITAHTDNTYDIVETIDVRFNTYKHGIYRDIPTRYNGKITPVTDVNTFGETAKIKNTGSSKYIRLGDADITIIGDKQYTIAYTLNMGADMEEDMDAIYLNIIGTDWGTKIYRATFDMDVSELANDERTVNVTMGYFGSTETLDVTVTDSGTHIAGATLRTLMPYEGLTLYVAMPEGTFLNAQDTFDYRKVFTYGVPLITLILLLFWRIKYGTRREPVPVINFYPPEKLNPTELGYIIDEVVDSEDIGALIVYWASLGYLRIKEERFGKFTLIKSGEMGVGHAQYEVSAFNYLWRLGDGTQVTSSELTNKYYTKVSTIRFGASQPYKSGSRQLYTKKAKNKANGIMMIASLCMVALAVFGMLSQVGGQSSVGGAIMTAIIFLLVPYSMLSIGFTKIYEKRNKRSPGKTGLLYFLNISVYLIMIFVCTAIFKNALSTGELAALLLVPLLVTLLRPNIRQYTDYGFELLQEVLGFKQFITNAEKTRLEILMDEDKEYVYKILPYAMVLGVSDIWAKKFNVLMSEPPNWYTTYGTGTFTTSSLMKSMSRTATQMSRTASSSPSSSSSGGGGGGGSSGGGGGGGGGGSW